MGMRWHFAMPRIIVRLGSDRAEYSDAECTFFGNSDVTAGTQPLVGEILLEDKMLSGAVSVDIEFSMYIAKLLCAKFEIFRYSWLIE